MDASRFSMNSPRRAASAKQLEAFAMVAETGSFTAAAEHLGLVPVVSAWNLAMAMMTLYLGVGTYLQLRTMRWKWGLVRSF